MVQPSENEKVLEICKLLNKKPVKMTPKRFMEIFLASEDSDIAYLRRLWSVEKSGLKSTLRLLPLIRDEVLRTEGGQDAWSAFIQREAVDILVTEEPPRGAYPRGSFHSSLSVQASFFTRESQQLQDTAMTTDHMPFLYGLIMGMLQKRGPANESLQDEDAQEAAHVREELSADGDHPVSDGSGELALAPSLTGSNALADRFGQIATTICSIVAFAHNRRANFLQLNNAVRLYACGVSERVQEYLNHLGLCSSRKTAMSSLKTLAKEGAAEIRNVMAVQSDCPIAPTICIDNIDIEERVHDISVGNRSRTFRGTWGYIHVPNQALIQSLNWEELTLAAYQKSLANLKEFTIEPVHFMPTCEAKTSEMDVFKSQIAGVLLKYLAIPTNKSHSIPTDPPTLDQISHEKPTIHMLKMMDASDNSAEGIGQVFSSILQQSGLSAKDFYGRLQPMDGDLATIQNFNSLKSQRAPSPYGQDSLHNVIFQLGASHTMWNIASTIFTHHFGDSHDASNSGAWQYLEALGFPSEKAIQKKDFSLMINQMEKVLEATLYYCLRVTMKNENEVLSEERVTLPTTRWNSIVNECYERFCSPQARRVAAEADCPKLSNTLIQLHDFSSVVEAKRSMKAGDIGRLMNVWKKWCLMSQGLTSLTNYSSYLPRMVLLLTKILPPALQKYLCHNLLMSPSGQPNHFVAKDEWLELQNYWIKFLFNQTGNGTKIERLREIFSLNITLLQRMFQSLKIDCGTAVVHQSHKNNITSRSLGMFMQMATNRDILALKAPPKEKDKSKTQRATNRIILNPPKKNTNEKKAGIKQTSDIKKIDNTYLTGLAKMKMIIRTKDPELNRIKKHMVSENQGILTLPEEAEDSDQGETSSVDM
ncbi:hypothetical protein PSTT_08563 [Puccinia striiformis]|uniref:DUF6589 domain-containing protein n=1 Tax=Puccinia striiformis TaxID=27350 RepID=A0A2S4VC09_9BASI|nr:hypothetical protein PSTT_08563 [Puccinia striiformis]